MHALFFEMRPKPGHLPHYFDHVARLRPVLARHDGLRFLDRYGALGDPDLILSHQLWESEEAIVAWREDAEHRRSQAAGNKVHFADYRIRVGERILHRPWSSEDVTVREDLNPAASCVLALYGSEPVREPDFSAYKSLNHEGRYISLSTVGSLSDVEDTLASRNDLPGIQEIAVYSVRRDYGQFDRAEAPR